MAAFAPSLPLRRSHRGAPARRPPPTTRPRPCINACTTRVSVPAGEDFDFSQLLSPEPLSDLDRPNAYDLRHSHGTPVGAAAGIENLPLEAIPAAGALPEAWSLPGVYGIYDDAEVLMYVAAVHDVGSAIEVHRAVLPEEARSVRMMTVESEDEAPLGELAMNWVISHTQEGPGAPAGNLTDGGEAWRVSEEELAGTGLEAVYFKPGARDAAGVKQEIMRLLRGYKVLLFMKGTRKSPQCGFSAATVDLLSRRLGGEDGFEVVDCLDDFRNPGLRDGIKNYSEWPTIPQVYINGDFVGGADLVQEMDASGELAKQLAQAGVKYVRT